MKTNLRVHQLLITSDLFLKKKRGLNLTSEEEKCSVRYFEVLSPYSHIPLLLVPLVKNRYR